jgi:TetR/AcrR family transcriptional repressor of nem operon
MTTLAAMAETKTRILDVAERLAQTRGFNAFSYADISKELGLRKASIHHHFPSKTDLGEKLLARYEANFRGALRGIDEAGGDALRKLRRYAAIYADVLRAGRMCLCGMLAADFDTLPRSIQDAIQRFFLENEDWLCKLLEHGRAEGSLAFAGAARQQARMLVSSLEGAMLVARTFGDVARFERVAAMLLSELRAQSTRPSSG